MKKFILMGCLLALGGQVMAADWKYLSFSTTEGIFLNGDTESRTDSQAWFKLTYLKDLTEIKMYWQANCSNNQITMLSSATYNRSKKLISSLKSMQSDLDIASTYVIPDTLGEKIFKFICHHDPS